MPHLVSLDVDGAVAAITLNRPPMNALSAQMQDELDVTSLVITHDLESAYRISDRIAMLYKGRVQAVGTPESIQESDDPVVRAFVKGRPEEWEELQ